MSVTRLSAAKRVSVSGLYGASPIHQEVVDWQTRVVANSGTYTAAQSIALSAFCRAIDAEPGLRAAILRLNPFTGSNLSACLVPLYLAASYGATRVGSSSTDTNNNFVSGDFDSTGLKGNGSTKYLSTGVTPAAFANPNSVHLSYSGTSLETASAAGSASGDRFALGSYANVETSLYDMSVAAYLSSTNDRRGTRLSSFTPAIGSAATRGATESHLIGTRTSTTLATLYGGGTSVATATNTVTTTTSAQQFYVFGLNLNGSAGVLTAGRLRLYSIGNGLTAAQALAFSTAVAALNSALGR